MLPSSYPSNFIGSSIDKHGVYFRVWAPTVTILQVFLPTKSAYFNLENNEDGYFSALIPHLQCGDLYYFCLDQNPHGLPDPASRYQPQGPHGPSQIVDSYDYSWQDKNWKGVDYNQIILYELHVGTFTPEGTWKSAEQKLPYLKELGITVIELMPVAEFPGRFGWGYDGVNLFAPYHHYGRPNDLKKFIDKAHQLGLAVILDVVYNHLGPEGNYLKFFSENYFSPTYTTEWGEAINFEDNAKPIREFFIYNAQYWIEEFHFDGLRVDASQNIYDKTDPYILKEMVSRLKNAVPNRNLYFCAENEPQNAFYLIPEEKGGYGFDGLWNDDFHHTANVIITKKREAYHIDYRGTAQELLSCFKYGFLYQGQWYRWQNKTRGSPCFDLKLSALIHFLQNHDQIANSALGKRTHQLTSPALFRTMSAFLLLSPQTPLIFQGQEFAATAPFCYFADHHPELAKIVYEGRLQYLKQFESICHSTIVDKIASPESFQTFTQCKLNFEELNNNRAIFSLYKDLIQLRKTLPFCKGDNHYTFDGALLNSDTLAIRCFGKISYLFLINLNLPLLMDCLPEPLLALHSNAKWELVWSSEDPMYGGEGIIIPPKAGPWHIQGQCCTLLKATEG